MYGGLNACHTLCRRRPHLACFALTSGLGSVGSISQIKKQKKRSQSPSHAAGLLVGFSALPQAEGMAVGWIPPHHGGLPDLPSGLLHPRKCPCVVVVTSPSLRRRHRGVIGVNHEDHTLWFGLTITL